MKISKKTIKAIENELKEWSKSSLISKKDKFSKKRYGQFFTPTVLTVKMLEKFDSIKGKTILDPCMGDGNLLAAAIIAGADPKLVYGNEFDEEMLQEAKRRLMPMGVPEWHLHQGDALLSGTYEFSENYVAPESKYKGIQASGINNMNEVYKKENS